MVEEHRLAGAAAIRRAIEHERKGKMNKHPNTSTLTSPWIFFAVTLGWTWFFWILAAILGLGSDSAFGIVLQLIGVLGPMMTGIVFTYLTQDKAAFKNKFVLFWRNPPRQ